MEDEQNDTIIAWLTPNLSVSAHTYKMEKSAQTGTKYYSLFANFLFWRRTLLGMSALRSAVPVEDVRLPPISPARTHHSLAPQDHIYTMVCLLKELRR